MTAGRSGRSGSAGNSGSGIGSSGSGIGSCACTTCMKAMAMTAIRTRNEDIFEVV